MGARLLGQPWAQIVWFVVLCILLALPVYTNVSPRWPAVGAALLVVVFIVSNLPRRPRGDGTRPTTKGGA